MNVPLIFREFTAEEQNYLLKYSIKQVYQVGEKIIIEGEEGKGIFLILSGEVYLTKKIEPGEDFYLNSLKEGSVFGEMGIITETKCSATVTARRKTEVLVINLKALKLNKLQIARNLYDKLMRNLAWELSKKIYRQNDHLIQQKKRGLKRGIVNPPKSILVLFGWRWKDITREAVFLSSHGYDAIKISPPQEFVVKENSPWWAVYQPVSYKLSNYYGTKEDFIKMIDFCHSYNLKIYVDLVINHMAEYNPQELQHQGTNGTIFEQYHYGPLNNEEDYFTYDDFYHYKPQGNQNIKDEDYQKFESIWHLEHYDLLNLPKLNLTRPKVQAVLRKYISDLLAMGVDGFRIDAAKHLDIKSVEKIFKDLRTNNGYRPFLYQEYYTGPSMGVDLYSFMEKYFRLGYVTSFKYGEFLADAITGRYNNLQTLMEYSFGSSWIHYPENRTVSVIDNHDTERMMGNMLNFNSPHNYYVLAYIFMLAWPFGIPKIMSSFRFKSDKDSYPLAPVWQEDRNTCFDEGSLWVAQHRWNAIANMVLFNRLTKPASGVVNLWTEGNQVVFSRVEQYSKEALVTRGFVAINATGKQLKGKFNTGLPNGEYYNLILSSLKGDQMEGPTLVVENYGQIMLEIPPYEATVLLINFQKNYESKLNCSG